MGLNRNPEGPLRFTTLRRIGDVIFFAPTNPPDIDPADTDVRHIVKIADRIDLLASRFLGNPQLGWAILLRNDLRLMPNDLLPGSTIFIPTLRSLRDRGIL